jgi:hypothetical protein
LCIGGLELDPRLVRRGLDGLMGWEGDRLEEEKCAPPAPLVRVQAVVSASCCTMLQQFLPASARMRTRNNESDRC